MVICLILILILINNKNSEIIMGNSSHGPSHTFLNSYNTIQVNDQEHLKYLQHKITNEQYLLKQLTFNNVKECHKMLDKLAQLKLKLTGCKNVVELKEYLMCSEQQYCGTFFKIFVLFQYPMRTLDDQIGERALIRKSFTEPELWSILASCVAGLSHLQKHGIKHQSLRSRNIILSQQGIIKVSDPSTTNLPTNYQSLLTKRSPKHIYPSPQQLQSLQQELILPTYNTHKNDVFTLGMIMLEAALLEYQDEVCYSSDKYRIRWEGVEGNLGRLGGSYSLDLRNMVEFMLGREEGNRPDWVFLEQNCMDAAFKKPDMNASMQSKKQSSHSSDKFSINSNIYKYLPFQSTPQITTTQPQNQNTTPFIKIDTSRAITDQRGPAPPPIYHLPKANMTFGTPAVGTQPQIVISPVKVNGFQLYNNGNGNVGPSLGYGLRGSLSGVGSRVEGPMGFSSRSSLPVYQPSPIILNQNRPLVSIPPLRPSVIYETRPLRNIFPADFYQCRTKIDDNIIKFQPQNRVMNINFNNHAQTQQTFQPQPTSYSTPSTLPAQSTKDNQRALQPFKALLDDSYPQQNIQDEGLEYVVENYQLGSRYQGQKLNGLRHGKGRFYYQDGGMYDGEWKQNYMHGYGKLYYQSDKLAYEGQWIHDQFSGKGVIYNEEPELLLGEFDYRNFDDLDQYWSKYEGEFINDSKYGRGTLYLSNGQKFDGYFKADYVQGPGTFYCRDGTPITGTWSQNRKIA